MGNLVTCYDCGEQGHISTNFQKPKKNQSGGKVFALSETTSTNKFIRGTCYIDNIPLIATIDNGATNSFISFDYAKWLGLELSSMVGSMIVDTPALGPMTTSLVCLYCPLTIYDKNFGIDLVCPAK